MAMRIVIAAKGIECNCNYDSIDLLVLIGDCDVKSFVNTQIDVCVFEKSNFRKVGILNKVKNLVSCGMNDFDTVTFSSISEDSASLCIRRTINRVYPCEFKTKFYKDMDLYSNLVVSLILYFLK